MVEMNVEKLNDSMEENKNAFSDDSVDLSDSELYGMLELSKAVKSKIDSAGASDLRRLHSVQASAPRISKRINQEIFNEELAHLNENIFEHGYNKSVETLAQAS